MNYLWISAVLGTIVTICGLLIWRPWGKATLFGGDVKVEYKKWTSVQGGVGNDVYINFILHGKYRVTIDSPTFEQKNVIINEYEAINTPMQVNIDIEPFKTNQVKITITELKEHGVSQICRLYAF